jgi:hypothetical protein
MRILDQLRLGNLTGVVSVSQDSYGKIRSEEEALLFLGIVLPQLSHYEDYAREVLSSSSSVYSELEGNATALAEVGMYMATLYSVYSGQGETGLRNYLKAQVGGYLNATNELEKIVVESNKLLGSSFINGIITVPLPPGLLGLINDLRRLIVTTLPIARNYCEEPIAGVINVSYESSGLLNAST